MLILNIKNRIKHHPPDLLKSKKISFFLIYTILFAAAAAAVFCWYFLSGRTLIWETDGLRQHYKALLYYGGYLRDILRGVLNGHGLVIPAWDFSIGEGSDILKTLHYYVIGDPFALLSVFVPARFMYLFYDAMILLRLYLAGAAFSLLCFQTGCRSRFAAAAGSMTYVFCYWSIFCAARHPFFLNPMIYLPLLILGVEKIIKRKRPLTLILAVFLSAVSSFYFFYILALTTALYTLIRLYTAYGSRSRCPDKRKGLAALLRTILAALSGTALASFLFLPMCYFFLSDARAFSGSTLQLFYPFSYYSRLFSAFLTDSGSYWMCMGYAAPVLPAVLLLYYKKKAGTKKRLLRILFFTGIIFMLFPFFGQIFNGFSYMANRWSFAFALLNAYILTAMWPSLMKLRRKELLFLSACQSGYVFLCLLLDYSRNTKTMAALCFAFIFVSVLSAFRPQSHMQDRIRQSAALLLVLVCVFHTSYWKNSSSGGNYASESITARKARQSLHKNETAAIRRAAAADGVDEFYRYSGRSLTHNAGMPAGISSTQYYWTLSNPYISQYRRALKLRETASFNYMGFDGCTIPAALDAVRYYCVPDKDTGGAPYGFTPVENNQADKKNGRKSGSGYTIYRNEYALPLAYTFDSFIPAGTWDRLSAVQKQEALLQGVVLKDYNGRLQETPLKLTGTAMDYTVRCNSRHVTRRKHAFAVTKKGASVTLSWKGLPQCETYFVIDGLSFDGASSYDLYLGSQDMDPLDLYSRADWNALSFTQKRAVLKNKLYWKEPDSLDLKLRTSLDTEKTLSYHTKSYNWYNNRHDFAINLGYSRDAVTSLTISFPHKGVYSFDSIQIFCQPMDNYADYIQQRKADILEDVKIGPDQVSGAISLDTPKFLLFSIPYSKGWQAYVDGQKAELYPADTMYLGLDLDAGSHSVTLVYHRPYQKAGFYLSAFSAAAMLLYLCYKRYRSRCFPGSPVL